MIKQSGADELRMAVRLLGDVNESLLDCYSAAELLQLVRMWRASKWDISPDEWTARQLHEATRKHQPRSPNWREINGMMRPIYEK